MSLAVNKVYKPQIGLLKLQVYTLNKAADPRDFRGTGHSPQGYRQHAVSEGHIVSRSVYITRHEC